MSCNHDSTFFFFSPCLVILVLCVFAPLLVGLCRGPVPPRSLEEHQHAKAREQQPRKCWRPVISFPFYPFPFSLSGRVLSCFLLLSPPLLPCGFPCSLFSHLTCACQPACHGQPAIASLLGCLVAWLCVAASEPAAEPTTPRVLISGLGVLTTSFVSKCKTFPQVSGCQTWLLGPIGTD